MAVQCGETHRFDFTPVIVNSPGNCFCISKRCRLNIRRVAGFIKRAFGKIFQCNVHRSKTTYILGLSGQIVFFPGELR